MSQEPSWIRGVHEQSQSSSSPRNNNNIISNNHNTNHRSPISNSNLSMLINNIDHYQGKRRGIVPSNLPPTNISISNPSRGSSRFLFPSRLHQLLRDSELEGNQSIVSWLPDGKAFRVHKPKEFASQIVGRYFNHDNYRSFTRQLYHYGFGKIEPSSPRNTAAGAFYHSQFQRDNPDLAVFMVGQTKNKKGTSAAGTTRSNTIGNAHCTAAGEEDTTTGGSGSSISTPTQHQGGYGHHHAVEPADNSSRIVVKNSSFPFIGNRLGMLESPFEVMARRDDRVAATLTTKEREQHTTRHLGVWCYGDDSSSQEKLHHQRRRGYDEEEQGVGGLLNNQRILPFSNFDDQPPTIFLANSIGGERECPSTTARMRQGVNNMARRKNDSNNNDLSINDQTAHFLKKNSSSTTNRNDNKKKYLQRQRSQAFELFEPDWFSSIETFFEENKSSVSADHGEGDILFGCVDLEPRPIL